MKTITMYTLLVALFSIAACSKKSSSNSDDNAKFPANISSTWSRSVSDVSSPADTTTDSNTGQKWVKDIVILTSSEASKLQALIQAAPKQVKDDFAFKGKKFMDRISSLEIMISSFWETRTNTQEYKDLLKFCIDNQETVLPLAIAYLFNDVDGSMSGIGSTALNVCAEGKYEDLKASVNDERRANQLTEDGKYIVSYSSVSLQKRLAKKILNQL